MKEHVTKQKFNDNNVEPDEESSEDDIYEQSAMIKHPSNNLVGHKQKRDPDNFIYISF